MIRRAKPTFGPRPKPAVLLQEEGAATVQAETQDNTEKKKGLSPLAIGLIAGGSAIVVIALVALYLRHRKSASGQEEMLTPIQEELSSQLTSLSNY